MPKADRHTPWLRRLWHVCIAAGFYLLAACTVNMPEGFLSAAPRDDATLVLVWVHGSRDEHLADRCPGVPPGLAALDGTQVEGRPVRVYHVCHHEVMSQRDFATQAGARKLDQRIARLEALLERFQAQGIARERIVLAGQSCGAWAGLLLAARRPELVGRQIAFAPACHGPLAHNTACARQGHPVCRGILADREDALATLSATPRLNALIYGFQEDPFAPPGSLAFLESVPGVTLMQPRAGFGHLAVWSDRFMAHENRHLRRWIAGDTRNVPIPQ